MLWSSLHTSIRELYLGSHGANESQVILTALFPAETVTNGSQTVNRKNKFKSLPLVSLIYLLYLEDLEMNERHSVFQESES